MIVFIIIILIPIYKLLFFIVFISNTVYKASIQTKGKEVVCTIAWLIINSYLKSVSLKNKFTNIWPNIKLIKKILAVNLN